MCQGFKHYHLGVSSDQQYTPVIGDGVIGPRTTVHYRMEQDFLAELTAQADQGRKLVARDICIDARYADDVTRSLFEGRRPIVLPLIIPYEQIGSQLRACLRNRSIDVG